MLFYLWIYYRKILGFGIMFFGVDYFFFEISGISGIYEVIKLLFREVGILKEFFVCVLYCFV